MKLLASASCGAQEEYISEVEPGRQAAWAAEPDSMAPALPARGGGGNR